MRRTTLWSLIVVFLVAAGLQSLPAGAVQTAQPVVVNEDPANFTPNVLDGRVMAIAQVGDQILLGGTFTQVQAAGSTTTLARRNLLSFNATTGAISSSFVPNPDGEVRAIIPSGDGTSVFVGGYFNNVSGTSSPTLAKVDASTGALVRGFRAPKFDGRIKDLRLAGGRLWMAGTFTTVAGNPQLGLATVNPATGAFDPYMRLGIAGVHWPDELNQFTNVAKIDVDPSGTRLAAIGNFDTVAGVRNHQMFMLDLTGSEAALANWQTNFYTAGCSRSFDSYMRDLDMSPDGSYVVVSTTGAYGGSSGPCDTTARFEVRATGSDLQPTWIDYTGGDTTYAVAITGTAVYVGGHQRWQNNPFAGDRPGPGAVSRPGIAALDPANGLPLSWNPTRTRGVGVYDMLGTSTGLWVSSDTDRIGTAYEYRARIAFFPVAGGTAIPATPRPKLPGDVLLAGARGTASNPAVLYRINAGGGAVLADDGVDWAADARAELRAGSSNAATWQPSASAGTGLPAETPLALFDSERWGSSRTSPMTWRLPVTAGTPLKVRLYFANRCSCTSSPGQRVFSVDVDGTRVLTDYDIVAEQGDGRATMKEFAVTSDGQVDIAFVHAVENPLVNAIEVLRTDVAPPAAGDADKVVKRSFDGTTAGAPEAASDGGRPWSKSRGAFMLNGTVYTAWSDGTFTRQTFDGSAYGSAVPVNTSDLLVPLAAWQSDIQQMTGIFFEGGRVYFTLAGSSTLYYRYFSPESDVVGAHRYTASGNVSGLDLSTVRGMFLAGDHLYWTTSDGLLRRTDWSGTAPVAGTTTPVTGAGGGWTARSTFVFQGAGGAAVNQAPSAILSASCEALSCDFDGSSSFDGDGGVTAWQWTFGDGTTATGAGPHAKTYTAGGTYTVTLRVTDDRGATSSASRQVTVEASNAAPAAAFTVSCDKLVCGFDGSTSSDADGTIASYAWDYGDGSSGSGRVPAAKTYSSSGTYTVTLTVTDDRGAQSTAVRSITVSDALAQIAFRGVSTASTNGTSISVPVPAATRPGDGIVLILTTNLDTVDTAGPTGVTGLQRVDSVVGQTMRSELWQGTAGPDDAGKTVTIELSSVTKVDVQLATYSGTSSAGPVLAYASAFETELRPDHQTPTIDVTQAGVWAASYWADKTSSTTSWSAPAGVVERAQSIGQGGGRITSLLADSGAAVPQGAYGGLVATANSANRKAAMWTIALAPAS